MQFIEIEKADRASTITLNRPAVMNAVERTLRSPFYDFAPVDGVAGRLCSERFLSA